MTEAIGPAQRKSVNAVLENGLAPSRNTKKEIY